MTEGIELYVTDAGAYPVRVEGGGAEAHLRGLPIMRAGTWNGVTYDADRLRRMAANYGRIAEADQVSPALKSRHTYGKDGAENVDAGEVTRGWFDAVYFDETSEVLFGDVRAVDPALVDDMRSGRVRYVSAEVVPEYRLADSEDTIGPALVGAAFVDWPAVKGLPWEIVLNGAEFTQQRRRANATQRGGKPMSKLIDVLKGLFAGTGDPEELEQFRADMEPQGDAPADTPDETPDPKATPDVLAAKLEAEIATLRAGQDASQAEIAGLTAENREAKVNALVDALTVGGTVPPANQPAVRSIIATLVESGQSVTVPGGDAEAEPVVRPAVEVFVELLQASAPKGLTGPAGRANATGEGEEPGPEKYSDEKLIALTNAVK